MCTPPTVLIIGVGSLWEQLTGGYPQVLDDAVVAPLTLLVAAVAVRRRWRRGRPDGEARPAAVAHLDGGTGAALPEG